MFTFYDVVIILITLDILTILKNESLNIVLTNIIVILLKDCLLRLYLFNLSVHEMNAFIAERQIKKWNRYKKEALIENNWDKLSLLAKKKFD